MLRLFLRLYLLLALGFAAAIFVVDHVIDAFYDSIVENYHRDAVRGQAYSLVEKLAPLDQAGRQRQLEDWRPHYGLELSLTDARQAKLTQEEQALLDKNLLVVREDFTEFISRIDAGPQLLDIKLPPEPSLTPLFTVLAYILLGVLVGIALLLYSVQRHQPMSARQRIMMYRFIEWVGRWSMLDIFVIAILVALVNFGNLASIEANLGAAAFASVVVLTMLAAVTFDPRLIWDNTNLDDENE